MTGFCSQEQATVCTHARRIGPEGFRRAACLLRNRFSLPKTRLSCKSLPAPVSEPHRSTVTCNRPKGISLVSGQYLMRCSPFLVVYPACFVKAFFCTSALCNIWPASSSDDYMPLPGSIIMCRDRMWAKIGIRAARSGAPITSSALVVRTLDLALPPPSFPLPVNRWSLPPALIAQ